jgi:phosphohistidine phosphatase
MDVYIMRHGKAGRQDPGKNDSSRVLTGKGKDEIEEMAKWLVSREISFDTIATSPLVRAMETGTIIAAGPGKGRNPEIWSSLSIGGDPMTICQDIAAKDEMSSLLLVGHEPILSSLIGLLICGSSNAGILMAKGGLARVRNVTKDGNTVHGELHWLLTPKLILGMRPESGK